MPSPSIRNFLQLCQFRQGHKPRLRPAVGLVALALGLSLACGDKARKDQNYGTDAGLEYVRPDVGGATDTRATDTRASDAAASGDAAAAAAADAGTSTDRANQTEGG